MSASIETLPDEQLPPGDVTVGVEYSSLNYKDGLIVTGGGGLVKRYPHAPGIDFAGTVLVMCPVARRREAWERLHAELSAQELEPIILEARLADVPRLAAEILRGKVRGRVVIDIAPEASN